ncbi:MAG: penicillin-binding protein 2 [Planctomycetota bacterium]
MSSRTDLVGTIVVAAMLLGFAVVVGRIAQLQLAPQDALLPHVQERVSSRTHPARRGDLLDRRGRLLAGTQLGHRVFVDPSALQAPYGPTLAALSEVTGVSVGDVADRVLERVERSARRVASGEGPIRYVSVGRALTEQQVIAAQRLDIPGVHLERVPVRTPAAGDTVASIIGKVGADHDGLLGAELAFDAGLRPQAGAMDYVRDARGRPLWVRSDGYTPPAQGENVRLSIDLVIQEMVLEEVERGVLDADAAGGRAIVADAATGEILAMVDHVRTPGPSDAVPFAAPLDDGVDPETVRYITIPADPHRVIHPAMGRNRCVEDLYEPGSTFKPFMWASVTERSLATPDEVFDTHDGVWRTGYGRRLEDVVRRPRMTWREVLVLSSNIGMAQGTERLTAAQMRADVLRFGFGAPTKIGLPGESPGLVTSSRKWSNYTHTSVAMGHEIGVTPLQMVRAFSAFARTGQMAGTMPMLTLRAIDADEPSIHAFERVIRTDVAATARHAMVAVADNVKSRMPTWYPDDPECRYTVFGKSGTAEIPRPDGKGYFDRQHVSSFIAGAPVDMPRIVVLVVIDDPGPSMRAQRRHYGSATAGPVVLRVTRRVLEYFGVPTLTDDLAVAE